MKKFRNTPSKRWRLIGLVLILLIFLGGLRAFTGKTGQDYRTEFPTLKKYEKKEQVVGFNIFSEEVYHASEDGVCVYNASEGERVPVGFEIATVNTMNDTSNLNDALLRVNSALSYKSKDHTRYTVDQALPSVKEIQEALKDNDLTEAISHIEKLDLYSNSTLQLSELKELNNLTVEELETRKTELEKEVNQHNIPYKAEFSGIVSFAIDGLEEYYTLSDREDYTYSYLQKHREEAAFKTHVNVTKGEPLFKLVDNIKYHIALQTKSLKNLDTPEIGDRLQLQKNDKLLEGTVVAINQSNAGQVVIVEFKEHFSDIYSTRINNFDVILASQDCYEIPKDAIIKRGTLFGVYVQEIHGLVKFVPIKVVVPFETTSYIDPGDKNARITIDDAEYKTVTLNDKIVLNPKQVAESKVLN
ncbi:HlyD family efflux transporter periplasmic adaptor subunit [Peptoniphilus equinus]|uniref:HlyD family efflux transporter periplasmic adaptor subunit n=1 Tax=Peptoniphilus equinus TaxID=3016343 RepID=A0ABY7QVA8_9FIRM|nr:HlyD family efflux transporter periplasmic adaptor subunit [Peptoniphilus equinus]WBW50717.1 HlyD family efflux transporter periplasmic adaptor subunit [Peptoniphilus equinus]